VHVDPPAEHKAYLHRSGRTARAGSEGVVVTVMLPEQAGDVRTLTRQAKINVQPQQTRPGSRVVAELVGEVAPLVTPTAASLGITPAPGQPRRGDSRPAGGGNGRRRGAGGGAGGGRGRGAGAGASAGGQGGAPASAGGRSQGGGSSRGGQPARPARAGGGARRGGGSTSVYSTSTGGATSGAVAMSMAGNRRSR
jgi:hypothetical protein